MSDLQLVPADKLIDVPGDVAVCPYCGAALFVQCEQWSQQDDGSWAADNVHADCTGETDVGTPQWEEWLDSHSQMPYVYKLPVDMKVEKWVNEHYRFDLS